MFREEILAREERLVVLDDYPYPWVREAIYGTSRRKGPIRKPANGFLVAYAECEKEPSSVYLRRYWWRRDDESAYDDGWCPTEAVTPHSICVNRPSERYEWAHKAEKREDGSEHH